MDVEKKIHCIINYTFIYTLHYIYIYVICIIYNQRQDGYENLRIIS